LGNKQIFAKQEKNIKPEVDFHFTWEKLYLGFDIDNASKYKQINYQIEYKYSGDLVRFIEGSINNSSEQSSIEREKIILGSESTDASHGYDNETSPVTLTVEFSKFPNKFIPSYSVEKSLSINQ